MFTASVLHLFNMEDNSGVWAKEYNARLANKARRMFKAEFNEMAEKIFDRQRSIRNGKLASCTNPTLHSKMMKENMAWEQRVRDIQSKDTHLDQILS